jgi:hypothetical protein
MFLPEMGSWQGHALASRAEQAPAAGAYYSQQLRVGMITTEHWRHEWSDGRQTAYECHLPAHSITPATCPAFPTISDPDALGFGGATRVGCNIYRTAHTEQ